MATILSTGGISAVEIDAQRIAGGGGEHSGGAYELVGTIGQHEAGEHSGGRFTLSGGFWASAQQTVPVELMSFEIVSRRGPVVEPAPSDRDRGASSPRTASRRAAPPGRAASPSSPRRAPAKGEDR